MKKISFLLFSIVILALTSCEKSISPETAKAFVGEYWMKTTVCTMYEGNVTLERGPVWSPASIYEENGSLFVKTDRFGAPDTDTTSVANHEYVIDYPDHPNYVITHKNDDDPEGSESGSIENITDNITRVYLMDGALRTVRNGAELRSLPIKVRSGSETVLNLCDFKPFRVTLTDASGTYLAEVDVAYKYGPMVKNGEVINWDVTLPFDFLKSYSTHEQVDEVIHKNTLYKL